MFTARVKRLKEETFTFTEMRDIEDLVVTTMGEDVWLAILEFTQGKNEELENKLENLKEDLETGEKLVQTYGEIMQDIKDKIEALTEYVNNAKRLDKRGLKKRLEEIDFILYKGL
jgi:methyl-accepting chemotaxis protein